MTALPPPPAELSHLSAHLAPSALLALIEAFGGTTIYVPHAPNQASPLAQALGRDAALRLAAALGGERIKVPLARHWRIRVLRERDGLSYGAIARRLGLTEDAVWRHLRAARLTVPQPDLFG